MTRPIGLAVLVMGLAGSACADDVSVGDPVQADHCLVFVHGKGGTGAATLLRDDGVAVIAPTGNGEGWGDREWRYGTDLELEAAIEIVTGAIDDTGCLDVAMHGFSNGAAFAARVLCVGETFAGRLTGVVVDDPVPDTSAEGCERPSDIPVALYWTGALDRAASPGAACVDLDWTCRDDVLVGIDSFAADLGTERLASPHADHQPHIDALEALGWLR